MGTARFSSSVLRVMIAAQPHVFETLEMMGGKNRASRTGTVCVSLGNVSFVALVFVLTNFSCFHCVELSAMPVIYGKSIRPCLCKKRHSRERGERVLLKH